MHQRTRIILVATAALALLAGCGDRSILLNVDALSFTAPGDRALSFGPVPSLNTAVQSGEVAVFDDLHVKLLGGTKDVVDVQSVTLTFGADFVDSTGAATDTLRVYMSDAGTDPRTTTPVIVAPVALTPGTNVPVHVVAAGDSRLIALFAQQEMRVTITTAFSLPANGGEFNGRLAIDELRAAVLAKHHTIH